MSDEWVVDVENLTAKHIKMNLAVKFEPDEDDATALNGRLVQGDLSDDVIIKNAPRLMREAGEAMLQAINQSQS